jgi:hypothetical protein
VKCVPHVSVHKTEIKASVAASEQDNSLHTGGAAINEIFGADYRRFLHQLEAVDSLAATQGWSGGGSGGGTSGICSWQQRVNQEENERRGIFNELMSMI